MPSLIEMSPLLWVDLILGLIILVACWAAWRARNETDDWQDEPRWNEEDEE